MGAGNKVMHTYCTRVLWKTLGGLRENGPGRRVYLNASSPVGGLLGKD